jgi:hypothetical protein
MIAEQQVTKKTKAYKNPVVINKNSIKLEKDMVKQEVYYITFTYSSEKDIVAKFYFNAEMSTNKDSFHKYQLILYISFIPTENFKNMVLITQCGKGNNIDFLDKNVYIDIDYFEQNRIFDTQHTDLIIELSALNNENKIECYFATFCKLIPDTTGLKKYKVKPEMQKLKVNDSWFDLQDVYGISSENIECEICCANKRNTIFLPCKHSYACKECAINLRMRGNNCPICRIRNILN